ncbi:MAG: DNA cytosine methyltransferase [Sulfuricurvum sp.]|uniref:DNA cytosine methyltransferase n=1 Tax=Sulfuricurvum sp. TaxID=2025608 RepID=UPI002734BC8A|nr:DNA cytosine methyltransferase [Sulfuricurvum sp.]MDP3291324.1 DNA cytosine methyltransferase [Sulfuricurvum sp.]
MAKKLLYKKYKFIDLFAGIGGFHTALHNLGAECVFASEIDKYARETYIANFENKSPNLFKYNHFNADITSIKKEKINDEIPDFDILCGGFPCQPFSQAGFKKGFDDDRGNLFFHIAQIIEEKKPKAFLLENVRHLVNHDDGRTFSTIRRILEEELEYSFYPQIIKATDFGLPQHRPRIFLVGFKKDKYYGDKEKEFKFPEPKKRLDFTMSDIWEGECSRDIGLTLRVGGRCSPINDRRNWDGYLVNGEVKRLTPKEGKAMQGFPKDFIFPVTDIQAMKQLGNSVAVPVVQAIANEIIKYIIKLDSEE